MLVKTFIEQRCIPLDKSWIIRMGVLDLLHGHTDIFRVLQNKKELNDDLLALKRTMGDWGSGKPIDVGESGTLYRFLQFASWKLNLNKQFIRRGTLAERKITDHPKIISYSLSELLKLDNGTSQWASAAVLLGNEEKIPNPPYKLQLTYDAVAHWKARRGAGKAWEIRHDKTILRQAETFLQILKGEPAQFSPEQSEDYCFARAFVFITKEEGEKRWPSLRGHESDRIKEMEEALKQLKSNLPITSKDHRIIQAVAMLAAVQKKKVNILRPEAVKKSWPQFWRFMWFCSQLN